MPTTTNDSILATRCLNATRLLHPPTYVATQYLSDSLVSDRDSAWAPACTLRRYSLRQTPRLFKSLRFKKIKENGQREYRELHIPSPMTCLAEAVVLNEISTSPSFKKPTSVYSYLWPRNESYPHNFEYYLTGYMRRNVDIAKALKSMPQHIAIITDIEKFYPSIQHDIVQERFTERIEQSSVDKGIQTTALSLFHQLLTPFSSGQGIPIGPDLSCILGDVALSNVDQVLRNRFPNRYFRYVDDIVLIVAPEEKQQALQIIEGLMAQEHLSMNQEKHDIVSSADWMTYGPVSIRKIKEFSFESLIFRLKVFLMRHPEAFQNLQSALMSEGFHLPIGRLQRSAEDRTFLASLKVFLKCDWSVARDALSGTIKTLVEHAKKVRDTMQNALLLLGEPGTICTPTLRLWHIQRLRYLANRLLYLLPTSDLSILRDVISNLPEFTETLALLKFRIDRDCTDLLRLPGAAVATAASLVGTDPGPKFRVQLPRELRDEEIHSAAVLLLYNAAETPPGDQMYRSSDDAQFLAFCSGDQMNYREHGNFSYIDEIRTLQLQRSASERMIALDKPIIYGGEPPFEALRIGVDY